MSRQEQKKRLSIISQAYCTKRNEHKELDPDLLEDIIDILIDNGIGDKDRFECYWAHIKTLPKLDTNIRCDGEVIIKPIDYKENDDE